MFTQLPTAKQIDLSIGSYSKIFKCVIYVTFGKSLHSLSLILHYFIKNRSEKEILALIFNAGCFVADKFIFSICSIGIILF